MGRAYDMAKEIRPHLDGARKVIDTGCGNGFIAHHLSALLPAEVLGVDVRDQREVPISFCSFDGQQLPFDDRRFDGAMLCYVLHHCDDPGAMLSEVRRVLVPGGRLVIYEDIPSSWFDGWLCQRHHRAWRDRGGARSFHSTEDWRRMFADKGLSLIYERALSRARDLNHPVDRGLFVLSR